MRPPLKRNVITIKTTGRRYYLGQSSHRPNGRRYYVCSKPDCEVRLLRESDIFCRAHLPIKQTDNLTFLVDEDILDDHSELMDEETVADVKSSDSMTDDNLNNTIPFSSRQRKKASRDVQIDEATGRRTFRDESGRYRYLCMFPSCTNMLRRQTDHYCPTHATNDDEEKKIKPDSPQRYSAPPTTNSIPDRFRSPFSTSTAAESETNGDHSDEYEPTQKTSDLTGTTRSFRDASGKIRFLCLNPTCNSRLVRRADLFCKRHQLAAQVQQSSNPSIPSKPIDESKEDNKIEPMDVNHNNPDTPSRQRAVESPIKKRKQESHPTVSKLSNFSIIPANKMVIAATTLLDSQWKEILIFLRQFPDVQLSTNLNVNNSTTHLLVDDSEHALHCTITKKIVQAAVRGHIFIISSRWIGECIRSNAFPTEYPYEIQSDSHTTLRLSTGDSCPLFNKSYGFAIECRQCQGSINRNELIELIELTGGKVYDHDNHIDMLIVLCDTNERNLSKIKEKYLQTNLTNIKYVTSDFLLKSIIKFEIQDIDKYSL